MSEMATMMKALISLALAAPAGLSQPPELKKPVLLLRCLHSYCAAGANWLRQHALHLHNP